MRRHPTVEFLEESRPRTMWSLSDAITSAFKELDPTRQIKAAAKLGEFLEARVSIVPSSEGVSASRLFE